MHLPDQDKPLDFSSFPSATVADWKARILKDLKEKVLPESLTYQDIEGIVVPAYLTEDEAKFPWSEGFYAWVAAQRKPGWRPMASVKVDDASQFGFIDTCKGLGAESIHLQLDGSSDHHWPKVFQGHNLKDLALVVSVEAAHESLLGYFNANYPGLSALRGGWEDMRCSVSNPDFDLIDCTYRRVQQFPNTSKFKSLTLTTSMAHEAGASPRQEICFALSLVSFWVRQLVDRGVSAEQAWSAVQIRVMLGNQFFGEIAKVRALQMLLAQLQVAWGLSPQWIPLIGQTSTRDFRGKDPDTNILRHTTEALAAVAAGVNHLIVLPHTGDRLDGFGQRIAINISHLIREEGYGNSSLDPVADSYFVDALTDVYAKEAWRLFQEMEEAGGYLAALESGYWAKMFGQTAQTRISQYESGTLTFVGDNLFPYQGKAVVGDWQNALSTPTYIKPMIWPEKS